MFGITDGFDVVIGNPPYVQLQSNHGELADRYKNSGYESFVRSGDLYQIFYERGYQFLQQNGLLCFITSNKWMRAGYGETTRRFFSETMSAIALIDFAGQKVFESATVDVNIILLQKNKNTQETLSCIIKEDCKQNMTQYIGQAGRNITFPRDGKSWVILSCIEQRVKEKIEKMGKPLKEWDIQIYRGILTGYNEAFIIDKNKRNELIDKDVQSANILRPILRGRDIKKYSYEFAELYLITTHNGLPAKNIPPVDIIKYPAIKEHLDKFWDKISKRGNKGITPYNLQSCAFLDNFSKQKIVYREISDTMNATLVESNIFINNKSYMITGNHLKYLLGIINSFLFNHIILQSANITGGKGSNFLEHIHVPFPLSMYFSSVL
jgi:type II restriction/modification system DNA methylase subunit YeeA